MGGKWIAAGTGLLLWTGITAAHEGHEHAPELSPAPASAPVVVQHPASWERTRMISQSEYLVDLGYVEPGSLHHVGYVLQSNLPLKVTGTQSECVCMSMPSPPEQIPMGRPQKLLVLFEAPKEPQHYVQTLTLQTSEPQMPELVLRLKARVGLPLAAEPEVLDLSRLSGQTQTTVTLRNDGDEPVKILYSLCSAPGCSAVMPKEPIPARTQVQIEVKLPVEKLPEEKHLQFVTSSKLQPQLDVRVTGGH